MNKFLAALLTLLLLSNVGYAQNVVSPCVKNSSGGCAPVSATNPLPVGVYGGTLGYCLISTGPTTAATFQSCGGGGGGSPGGSTNDIQYNAGAGSFGGITLTNGQLVVGQTASTPLAKTLSQDCTLAASGAITCLKTNNVSFGTAAVVNTGTSGGTIPLLNGANTWSANQTLSAVNLVTDTTTGMKIGTSTSQKLGFYNATPVVQQTGNVCTGLQTLGLMTSCTESAGSGITIGTTTITSGTNTRILYNNSGVVGEYTLTGSGTVAVMQNTPTLTTPVLGVATGTSLDVSGVLESGTNGGTGGQLKMLGATSGDITLKVPAAAGSNILTLPAGTTDFSATGGTGQFIKQASAGAAFTVAAVPISEVSGLGSNVATFLATPSSANLISAVTDETGTGALVFAGSPTFTGTVTTAALTVGGSLTTSAQNIVTDTTTGTKIGTSTSQKLGFYNATPIVQPTGNVCTGLQNLGLMTSCTETSGSGITIGTTTITSGTTTRILYNNAGVVGEYTLTGSGTVVAMATSPTFVTPTLGAATATTLTINSKNPVLAIVKQVFTASGTYTPTTGMTYAELECVGGGAGGGAADGVAASAFGGGGGGGGGYCRVITTAATIGASQTVTIGTSGAGGTTPSNDGSAGGDSSIGTLCIGKGGSGGAGTDVATKTGQGGAGGVAGTGDIAPPGMAGIDGKSSSSAADFARGGNGGSTFFGGGARSQNSGTTAVTGNAGAANTGGGGSGGVAYNTASDGAGGAGGTGVCYITEYLKQ